MKDKIRYILDHYRVLDGLYALPVDQEQNIIDSLVEVIMDDVETEVLKTIRERNIENG